MAISEDTGNQPVAVHPTGASPATTAAFTPQAGTLLVAMVGINGPSGTAITATITDSLSGGWTLLKRQNTSSSMGGTAEVWCRYLSSAPGSMTVTSTWTGGDTGATLVVRSLLGASSVPEHDAHPDTDRIMDLRRVARLVGRDRHDGERQHDDH
jgi:hypothetical protein